MMRWTLSKTILSGAALLGIFTLTACKENDDKIMVIKEQGSFSVGGNVTKDKGTFDPYHPTERAGQTLHADHAYVFYQIPQHARPLPLVFLHGAGQSSKTWESTPDGREGFQNIFLRKGFPVYLVDQPRRGKAGKSGETETINPVPDEQFWFGMFRLGIWPDYFEGVQFASNKETLSQYFRQMTPNTGPYDAEVIADAFQALFDKIGPGVLVTHSQGGGPGWLTVLKSPNVKAVVSYEPGSSFLFPKGEAPATMKTTGVPIAAEEIPLEEFMKFTKIPIVLYYGDNIPLEPSDVPGLDNWRVRFAMAKLWADAVNRRGGDVSIVHLPEIGIKGNTHFPFSDLNNLEIADLLAGFLKEKKLD